jgi:hypothetical protein
VTMRDLKEIGISYAGKIIKRNPPSTAEIKKLEQTLAVKLPEQYKQFLNQANGFIPVLNFVDIAARYGWYVDCFYHASSEFTHEYNLASASKWASEALGRPIVAIAGNGSGDQLIFDPRRDPEAIYLWNHEDASKTVLVAKNLETFLDMLGEEK